MLPVEANWAGTADRIVFNDSALPRPMLLTLRCRAPICIGTAATRLCETSTTLPDHGSDALGTNTTIRSLKPAVDLELSQMAELRGAFMLRPGHALDCGKPMRFEAPRDYPMASIPLSNEVSRLLVERHGPKAHPDLAVNLRCEEINSLVQVATPTDAALLAISDGAPGLVELATDPLLAVAAWPGLVTLARHTPTASPYLLRELMAKHLVGRPRCVATAPRRPRAG